MSKTETPSLRKLAIGYGLVYFSEGSFRSIGIFLPLYLVNPELGFALSSDDIAFIIATAYLAWNFKFILGLFLDLTPMIMGMRRRLWILAGQIFRILGILMILVANNIILIWIAAFIALSGDALVDMGADALLVDVAPSDWHGLGFGTGWASRAIGYSVSALITPIIIVHYGWTYGWMIFLLFAMPVFAMLFLKEPKDIERRTITKEAIALTFSDIKASASFFFLAYFSGAAYALDPNRGLLGTIVMKKLGISKPKTVIEYLESIPIVGYLMAAFGLAAAAGAFIMGYYTDKMGHKKAYCISLTGFLVALSLWLIDPRLIGRIISQENADFVGIMILSILLGFFEGWNFVAWESLIADSCPPQMAGFMFQYGMTGTHFSAFLVAAIAGALLDVSVTYAIIVAEVIVTLGYVPVFFLRHFATSKVMNEVK